MFAFWRAFVFFDFGWFFDPAIDKEWHTIRQTGDHDAMAAPVRARGGGHVREHGPILPTAWFGVS
jgi:hypothetical protein